MTTESKAEDPSKTLAAKPGSGTVSGSDQKHFRVEDISGKGKGIVACRDMTKNEEVQLDTKPLVLVQLNAPANAGILQTVLDICDNTKRDVAPVVLMTVVRLLDGTYSQSVRDTVMGLHGTPSMSMTLAEQLSKCLIDSKLLQAKECSAETVRRLNDAVTSNMFGFDFPKGDMLISERAYRKGGLRLFEHRSRLNHDCDPNCAVIDDAKVRLLKGVKAGVELTMSYRDLPPDLPLPIRQLGYVGSFECHCLLCAMEAPEWKAWRESDHEQVSATSAKLLKETALVFERSPEQQRLTMSALSVAKLPTRCSFAHVIARMALWWAVECSDPDAEVAEDNRFEVEDQKATELLEASKTRFG